MENKNKWIHIGDTQYSHLVVHEVKCPVCGHRETYTNDGWPNRCLLCETEMEGVADEQKTGN